VANDLIGKGWGFPFRVAGYGGIELVADGRELDESITIILGTSPGERVMRPQFGCRIHELVFHPLNSEILGLAERFVREALLRWEPRIEVESVDVEFDEVEHARGRLNISVSYSVRATKDERSLVYPFYVIERNGGG
jgi:phage baseplate assembly protein W